MRMRTREGGGRGEGVSNTGKWVCDIALIGCTFSLGKPKRGRDSKGRGIRGQWGTKGSVYEQLGTEVDDSYHSWREPSK